MSDPKAEALAALYAARKAIDDQIAVLEGGATNDVSSEPAPGPPPQRYAQTTAVHGEKRRKLHPLQVFDPEDGYKLFCHLRHQRGPFSNRRPLNGGPAIWNQQRCVEELLRLTADPVTGAEIGEATIRKHMPEWIRRYDAEAAPTSNNSNNSD
ncbi:MAG TPA: hypothetical protein VGU45_11965 [Microvirga sp.]|nr:hypothetical protein [Microvirga sp.]